MFILQTLKDFMDNPMGKGSMAITNRQLIKNDLNNRAEKLMRQKKITFDVYTQDNDYFIHFKIPSESERKNDYDVVIQFTEDEEDFKYDNFLNRYYVKFFSNCPSFVYTYAYAFNLYGMLVEGLGDKYDEKVLNEDPITRNPGEIVSYEKSIYFACYYIMQHRSLLNKAYLNSMASRNKFTNISNKIRKADVIELEIKKEENRLENEKKSEADRLAKLKSDVKRTSGIKSTYSKTGENGQIEYVRSERSKIGGGSPSIGRITPGKKITAKKSTRTK